MHSLVLCAVSKHEGKYLKDWIEYHRRLGIEKFIIYDEGSDHKTMQVLQDYCWDGLVEYVPATTHPVQYQAYSNCIKRYTDKTEWILFLDVDEFIVPKTFKDLNLVKFLARYTHPNIGGVAMAWSCFGTNKNDYYEEIPVYDRIFMRVDYEDTAKHHTRHTKSFVRPHCVHLCNDPHYFPMKPGYHTVDPNGRVVTTSEWASDNFPVDDIYVAHFSTKTREEWGWKFARGSADSGPDAYNARKIEMFDNHIKACSREDRSVQEMARKLGL